MNEKELIQRIVWNNNDKKQRLRLRTKMPDYTFGYYQDLEVKG